MEKWFPFGMIISAASGKYSLKRAWNPNGSLFSP
jgi:hypothetical protein